MLSLKHPKDLTLEPFWYKNANLEKKITLLFFTLELLSIL